MDTMLNLTVAHLNERELEYVPIIDGWGDRRGFHVRTAHGDLRIDTLDSEMHLRIRPVDMTGYVTGGGIEVHRPSRFLVASAIDAMVEYLTMEGA